MLSIHSVMSDSFGIPWTVAHWAPLSTGFSRQEYWSGLPFPPPEGGGGSSQPRDQTCVCLAGGFFTTEPPGSPDFHWEDGKFLWVDGYTALRIFNTMDLYKKRVNFIVYIIKIFLIAKKKKSESLPMISLSSKKLL